MEQREEPLNCKSRDGVTVGLIDSLMTLSRLLRERLKNYHEDYEERYQKDEIGNYVYPKVVEEALKDLQSDDDIYIVLQSFYNPRILSESERKLIDANIKTVALLKKTVGIK